MSANKLVLIVRENDRLSAQEEWSPGEPSPFRLRLGLHGESVQVVAHGTAYQWVLKNFTGIRAMPNADGACWIGEDAVFIINNLSRT